MSTDTQIVPHQLDTTSFIWPLETDRSWMHPSLDPVVLFMDNISLYDYFPSENEPLVSYHPMTPDERHVIQFFCATGAPYPFELFDRSNLMEHVETLPQLIRYAFYNFCAEFSIPPAPVPIINKFYTNARSIARCCIENPSLGSLQALLMLNALAAKRMDFAHVQYRDMAFRMASYLGLDTPKLLEMPNHVVSGTTKIDEDIRDRSSAEGSANPRFFNVSLNDYRYFSPPKPGQMSMAFHHVQIYQIMLHVKNLTSEFESSTDYNAFIRLASEAEASLVSWKNALPPDAELDWVLSWIKGGQTFGQKESDRIGLFLGYHTAISKLYRSKALTAFRHMNPATTSKTEKSLTVVDPLLLTAFNSALSIAKVAERVVMFPRFANYVFPYTCYSCMISGMILCELSDKVAGVERRGLIVRKVDAQIAMLEGVKETWKGCSVCKTRKRRCDGKIKGCIKHSGRSGQGSRKKGLSNPIRIAPKPSSKSGNEVSPVRLDANAYPGKCVETQIISLQLDTTPFIWPLETDRSWMHPSLDPVVLFMDNISLYDYFPSENEPLVSYHPMNHDERHIIQYFCTSRPPYPFEVFDRANLMEHVETLPQLIRYAFYNYCLEFSNPPAPLPIINKFYMNSKSIASWCIENPSLGSLQALLMLNALAAKRMDFAHVQYRDMAFRMASYLGLDTPKLLEMPNHVVSGTTKMDEDIRDRCWNLCLLTDSSSAEGSANPRFFNVSLNDYRYFSPAKPGETSMAFHHVQICEIMLHVKDVVSEFENSKNYNAFIQLTSEAEASLLSWKSTLPPDADLDWVLSWIKGGQTFGQKESDRIGLFLGYHTAISKLYRSKALTAFRHMNPATTSKTEKSLTVVDPLLLTAFNSALSIAKVAERVVMFPRFAAYVYPHACYCYMLSGMVLCELSDKVVGLERRGLIVRLVEAEIAVLDGAKEIWKFVPYWLAVLREGLQALWNEL
ncbi:hypothetical protein HDU97_005688 [Phlyctochytrium planicorne]|nr:hypothetical protein HDU97_005688 [Phlyctochytrium planicorne]